MVDSPQRVRRRSSAADRLCPNVDAVATTTTFAPAPDAPRAHRAGPKPQDSKTPKNDEAAMMPPPASTEPDPAVRPSRSDSGACRSTNRLSLTLPIAPHTGDRSRPTPITAAPSVPPTPVETPTIPLPADANEFIIAIAAQERRVLELREDLARAEADLASLKRQWTATEPFFQPGAVHHAELHGNSTPGALDDAAIGPRRSVDLDRRKLLLQGQNQSTPTQGNRRRFFRGGHTRALSLLSPARSNSEFSIHETHGLGPADPTAVQPANPASLKRASWQPRSAQNSPSVPQIVEDFKLGLRAFVEDIRQITVGDEPISGQSSRRGPPALQQGSAMNRGPGGGLGRPRTSFAPIGPNSNLATPTPASRFAAPSLEKPKPVKSKPFSWTPLGFDSMDDSDWSNWESPGPTKSPRWSDSTINSAGLEDIGPIPEMGEESLTPVKTQSAKAEALTLSPKLEEIIPNVVNRLSPRNLKRTANSLMDEWEKSLISPELGDKENNALET
ncbi:hypothetical protein HRG_003188 [Hirsutella rhossiliensis]|uniref:DUF4048 domain-containing protein n=1 Tax=Hirsutella rhossiliensis TaxID=111463 RepID=A0A9P8N5T5_9HYPO|nr:uncharacterized protein HRG_03188 [Hirsutella rhossiliensis]KAH0965172.1 hypothetical protein HRG_03188 [Hirsutella rhossiliensis]